jgi:RNA polymerase sigma-70 factor (ECF subfamily)
MAGAWVPEAHWEPPVTGLDDSQLAARFADGDLRAFDEIVRRHQGRVSALARRLLGWPDEADDVAQDVFVAAFRHLAGFHGQSSLATWLAAITINECRRRWRRRKVHQAFQRLWRRSEPVPAAGPQRLIADETSQRVRAAVRGLAAKYREVVVLRYLEEMSMDEIGRLLGITRNSAEVRLHRARIQLRQSLDGLMED